MDKNINKKQLELLLLLYKFRFITVELAAKVLQVRSANSLRDRLSKLVEQGYIGRRYDKSYRIKSRHAEYHLLPKGIAILRKQPKCNDLVLRNIYKDKTASESFVQQRLAIMATYCHLQDPNLKFLTQSQLAGFKGFPKLLPDGFISLKTEKGSKYFFLDVFREAEPFFVSLHRRAKRYIAYSESGDWQIEHKGKPFPAILLVCETSALQKRISKQMAKLTEASWDKELAYYTAIITTVGSGGKVWVEVGGEETKRIALADID